jgi:hypothetical protein
MQFLQASSLITRNTAALVASAAGVLRGATMALACQRTGSAVIPGSILSFLAPSRSAQTRRHASPCDIPPSRSILSLPFGQTRLGSSKFLLALASREHRRGTFPAQIPIAEPAARPTARTARDFVPWRFSDAGHSSVGIDHVAGVRKPAHKPITPSTRPSPVVGTLKPMVASYLKIKQNRKCM